MRAHNLPNSCQKALTVSICVDSESGGTWGSDGPVATCENTGLHKSSF